MDEFKWIQISFILVTVLQLTAGTGLSPTYYVIVGDDVALACGNVIEDQSDCDSTTWTWTSRSSNAAVELIRLGQITENRGFKLNKLSLGVNCSLVIKKVTKEDIGLFICQQYKSHIKAAPDAWVYLSVISMTEQKNRDEVTLICSVLTFDGCRQTVKWLFQNKDVEEHNQGGRTSCTASLTIPSYLEIYKSRYKSLECKVSVGDGGQLFPFKLQPSDENPGEIPTTATIKSTTPNEKRKTATDTTETGVNQSATPNVLPVWQWVLITVAVLVVIALVVIVLVVIVVKIIRRKRTAGIKSQRDDGATAPEDGVTYSSIKINEKKKGQAQVWRKKDADEGAEVTYSTLKASSVDPSIL